MEHAMFLYCQEVSVQFHIPVNAENCFKKYYNTSWNNLQKYLNKVL